MGAAGQEKAPGDPLNRLTPQGTVVEFLRLTSQRNFAAAAQYLEVGGRPAEPSNQAARGLAEKLKAVLDSDPSIRLGELSDKPEGALDDGLPPDRERLTSIAAGDGRAAEILLRRVGRNGQAGVWLFSQESLRRVPELYGDLSGPAVERMMPRGMVEREWLGVALWRWVGVAVLLPAALLLGWLLALIAVRVLAFIARRTSMSIDDEIVGRLNGPLRLFLAVWIYRAGLAFLDLPLLWRQMLWQVELVVGVGAITWFMLRLIDLGSSEARNSMIRSQRLAAVSMVPLGRRILKVVAFSLAVLLVLDNAGFDLKAVLTGLGVGGIAVALAAQRTLENIFGAVAIVLDQPVRVGDFCKFGNNIGTVEDIGLRSTRIRTLDRTVISVPNGQFSTMSVENFAPREKVWFHPVVSLRLDTTAAQTRAVLEGVRGLLEGHPKVEPGARVRLNNLGQAAINLEVFSYVSTPNFDEFVVIQENLLLGMMEVIERAGTTIAIPAQSGPLGKSEPPAA